MPIRVRLSAVMIVTFSRGVKTYQSRRKLACGWVIGMVSLLSIYWLRDMLFLWGLPYLLG